MCAQSQTGLSASELISLLDARKSDYLAMLYRVFIDDSADEKQQKVMVAGALIGTHAQWWDVRKGWKAVLKKGGIEYFRSTEYFSLRGQFAIFRDPTRYPKPQGSEAALEIRKSLEDVLRDVGIIALASSLPLEMYHAEIAVFNLATTFYPDPFSAVMQTVMNEAAILIRDALPGRNNCVAFGCDDSPDSPDLATAYKSFKRKNTQFGDMLQGLVHLDDKKQPPVQAADMVAGLGKEMALKHIETGARFDELPRMEGIFQKIYHWNQETVRQLASLELIRQRAVGQSSVKW
jgi:hypothetical protein